MTGALAVVLLGCMEPVLGWGLAVAILAKRGFLKILRRIGT